MEILKKYFRYALAVVVIFIVAVILISKCGKQVSDINVGNMENKQLASNTHKSDSLETVVTTLQGQLSITKVKDSLARVASNRLISYWKNKALNSRSKVDTLIQENPDLKEAFEDSDSLLSVTEKRNQELENEKSKQWTDFNKILSITEEQLRLSQETSDILSDQRNRYKKKSDKRFVIGPVVSIDYQLRPSIGVGITYRVFRF